MPSGVYGGISVFSGDGITVNGSGITVFLRGLTINGQGGGINGISFAQGSALTVEDCEIAYFTWGIDIFASNSRVRVRNTTVQQSTYGVYVTDSTVVAMDDVSVAYANTGVEVRNGALVTIANSHLANNLRGVSVTAQAGFYADVMLTHSSIVGSPNGIVVEASPGGVARLVSDGNAFNEVDRAFRFLGLGGTEVIYSPGNNAVGFNNGIVTGGSLTPLATF